MSDVQPAVHLQETSPRAEARGHPEVLFLPELLEMDQPARCWPGLFTETELRRAHDDSATLTSAYRTAASAVGPVRGNDPARIRPSKMTGAEC